jgi:twitching motility protein PilT
VRLQLGSVMKAVISQRLVPRADGKGRVPAIEVLLATARTRELIEDKDRTKEIPDAIAQGHLSYGMQTFDQSLMALLKGGVISYEEALRQATNPDDFALRVSGISATSDSKWDSFEKPADAPATGAPAAPRPPAAAGGPPRPPPTPPPAPGPAQLGRMTPARGTPSPAGAKPAQPGDDDFQIERF